MTSIVNMNDFVALIDFPNYLINRDGRIFSLYRGRYLKETLNNAGYYRYTLTNKEGKLITREAQRLIAMAWIPNPSNKPTVDHINRNPKDNRVENLRWVTRIEQSNNRISSYCQPNRKIYYEICDGYSKRYEKGSLANGKVNKSIYRTCVGIRATEGGKIYSYNPPCLTKPYKIALSSGPCAGKTTMLPKLKEKLEKYHYNVIIVPESATQLLNEGVKPDESFQFKIAERQLLNEINAEKEAHFLTNSNYNETIILLDRSFICNQAYCSANKFNEYMNALGINDVYERYDACIHLESGAKIEYHPEGRFETKEEAIELDELTKKFTSKHRNFAFIKAQSREKIHLKEQSLFSNVMKQINKVRSLERDVIK